MHAKTKWLALLVITLLMLGLTSVAFAAPEALDSDSDGSGQ